MEILLFIDLRDNYGITQCIIDKENKNFLELEKTQLETVIKIKEKLLIVQMKPLIKILKQVK